MDDVLVPVFVALVGSNAIAGDVDEVLTFDPGTLDFVQCVIGVTDDVNVAGNDTIVIGRVGFTSDVDWTFDVRVDDIFDALDASVLFVVGNLVTGDADAVLALDFVDDIVGVKVDLFDANFENNDAVVVNRVGFDVNVFRAFVVGPFNFVDVRLVVVAFVSGNVPSLDFDGTVAFVFATLDCVDGFVGVTVVFMDVKVAVVDTDVGF